MSKRKTTRTAKPDSKKPAKPTSPGVSPTESPEARAIRSAAFRLDPKADITGTHLVDHIEAQPCVLRAVFGKPQDCDGYKVSGQYVFSNDRGEVFTLYDWKATSLYFGPDVRSPEQLWNSEDAFEFNIGGKSDPAEFVLWLVKRVNDYFDCCDRLIERMEHALRKKGLDPSIMYAS